uniref:Uncharacterized protein n=1 Tax=Anopheles merus TaxID=30066 RepID=A0A182UY39_ANOME
MPNGMRGRLATWFRYLLYALAASGANGLRAPGLARLVSAFLLGFCFGRFGFLPGSAAGPSPLFGTIHSLSVLDDSSENRLPVVVVVVAVVLVEEVAAAAPFFGVASRGDSPIQDGVDEEDECCSLMSGVLGTPVGENCSPCGSASTCRKSTGPPSNACPAKDGCLGPPAHHVRAQQLSPAAAACLRCFLLVGGVVKGVDGVTAAPPGDSIEATCGGVLSSSITITSRSLAVSGAFSAFGSNGGCRCCLPVSCCCDMMAGEAVISRLGCIFWSRFSWAACSAAIWLWGGGADSSCLNGPIGCGGFFSGSERAAVLGAFGTRLNARSGWDPPPVPTSGSGPSPSGPMSGGGSDPASCCWPRCWLAAFFLDTFFGFGTGSGAAAIAAGSKFGGIGGGAIGPPNSPPAGCCSIASGPGGSFGTADLRFFGGLSLPAPFTLAGLGGLPGGKGALVPGRPIPPACSFCSDLTAAAPIAPSLTNGLNTRFSLAGAYWPAASSPGAAGGNTFSSFTATAAAPSNGLPPTGSSPAGGGGGFISAPFSPPACLSGLRDAPVWPLSAFFFSLSTGFFFTFFGVFSPACFPGGGGGGGGRAGSCGAAAAPTVPPAGLVPAADASSAADDTGANVDSVEEPAAADEPAATGGRCDAAGSGAMGAGGAGIGRSSGMMGMRDSGSLPSRAGEMNPDVVMITLLISRVGRPSSVTIGGFAPAVPVGGSSVGVGFSFGTTLPSAGFSSAAGAGSSVVSPRVAVVVVVVAVGDVTVTSGCSFTSIVCIGISTSSLMTACGTIAPSSSSSPPVPPPSVRARPSLAAMEAAATDAIASAALLSKLFASTIPPAGTTASLSSSLLPPAAAPPAAPSSSLSNSSGGMYSGMWTGRVSTSRLPGFRKFRLDSFGSGKRGTSSGSGIGSTNWMYSISSSRLMPISLYASARSSRFASVRLYSSQYRCMMREISRRKCCVTSTSRSIVDVWVECQPIVWQIWATATFSTCWALNRRGDLMDEGVEASDLSWPIWARCFLISRDTSIWGRCCHSFITSFGAITWSPFSRSSSVTQTIAALMPA